MTKQTINIGNVANDGTGDTLRTAFDKVNDNFTELYNSAVITVSANSTGNASSAIVFQTEANVFVQGTFQINTQLVGSNNAQNVTLNVARDTVGNTVNHTAHNTILSNNIIVSAYNVAIANTGNVQISVTPDSANLTANSVLIHTVSYRLS